MTARIILPCLVVLLIEAATPAQDLKEELDKFQGEWTMVSLEEKGKKAPDEIVKQYKLTIKGEQWTVSLSEGRERKMTGKIDPSKDPRTVDLTMKVKDSVTISRGIYKLEGDTLTLCRTTGNADRPREFKTTAEAGILVQWQRAKK